MRLFGRDDNKADQGAHQARIDAVVAAARAQAPTPAIKRPLLREMSRTPLKPSADLLDRRIEEELAFVRRTLDAVGERLADDPILLSRYQIILQSFDMLGQTVGHLASVVGAADRHDAVARIGMVELRTRLQRPEAGCEAMPAELVRTEANPFN